MKTLKEKIEYIYETEEYCHKCGWIRDEMKDELIQHGPIACWEECPKCRVTWEYQERVLSTKPYKFKYEDVKQAVFEFDELLKNEIIFSKFLLNFRERQKRMNKLKKQFKEIFGDF